MRVRSLKLSVVTVCTVLSLGMMTGVIAVEYRGFNIHGYASGGFLYTDNNNYLTADTEGGSFEAYDIGLNVTRSLTPELRLGAQAVFRKLGETGKDYPVIDWANVDYRPLDALGVRLGILKLPVGLYNEGRDLDMLRTPVFLPQTVYNEQLRDFFTGQPGGQLYGNVRAGGAGSFNYNLTLVNLQVDEEDSVWGNSFVDGVSTRLGLSAAQNPNAFPQDGWDFDNSYAVAAGLVWETPLDGFRLGGTYMYQDSDVKVRTKNPMMPGYDIGLVLEYYTIYSAEYTWNQWRFATEYMMYKFENTLGAPFNSVDVRRGDGYYAQVNYRVNERLELAAYYGIAYGNTDDRKGRTYEQLGAILGQPELYPDFSAWHKDFCLAARFDITMNWLVKLEWHYIDGVNQLYVADNQDGFDRYWNFFAVKTTYTF